MKYFLPAFFILLTGFSYSQKYVLIDKTMAQPIAYTNTVTLQHNYNRMFAVERNNLPRFITEVEKIIAMLKDKNSRKPPSLEFYVGKTRFVGLKVPTNTEERLDVVVSTDCESTKLFMHLSDSKISNANNVFFLTTWLKYIKSGGKS